MTQAPALGSSLSPGWQGWLQDTLTARREQHLLRVKRPLQSPQGPQVRVDGRWLHNFCSNDYLGLANEPALAETLAGAARSMGVGAGAAGLVCGHHQAHEALAEELADWLGVESVLLFGNGYLANVGVLQALAGAQERGELRIRPRHLGNGGEPLPPDVKTYLERVFKVPVLNAYASSEHLYMGLTLPGSEGLHLMEDDLIFETRPDHTCVTNLFNHTMPLIRYRMDDVLVPDSNGKSSYPFTRVKEVVGRMEDALVFTNRHGRDDFIHPIVIVELIIRGLRAWQIVLVTRVSFRFRAQFENGLSPEEIQATHDRIRQQLNRILAEKEMDQVEFSIEPVESLAVDPHSGKFRLVVRRPES